MTATNCTQCNAVIEQNKTGLCRPCFDTRVTRRRAQREAAIIAAVIDGHDADYLVQTFGMARCSAKRSIAMHKPVNPKVTVRELIARASAVSGFSRYQIISKQRPRSLVRVRNAICVLAREEGHSLSAIGRALGGRDHSTIIHSIECANVHIERKDAEFDALVNEIRAAKVDPDAPVVIAEAKPAEAKPFAIDFAASREDRFNSMIAAGIDEMDMISLALAARAA